MMEGQSKLRLLVHGLDGLSAAGCGVNGSMAPSALKSSTIESCEWSDVRPVWGC
jgi:hypothetical protein